MGRKFHSVVRGISGFIRILLGLALLAALIFFLNALLASRSSPTANQPQWPSSQQLSATPTPTSQIDVPENWKTYIDPNSLFQFHYPPTYSLSKIDGRPLLNHKIDWVVLSSSYRECQGGCPIVASEEEVVIAGHKATKVKGWIGDMLDVAQSYIKYEVQHSQANQFVTITLWELPQDVSAEAKRALNDGQVGEIPKEEEEILDQILSTFQFLD